LHLLDQLLQAAEAGARMRSVIEILIVRALGLQTQGKLSDALTALAQALTLAAPEGYVRIFVDEGAPMAALLRQARSRGIAPDYVGRLLAAFGRGTASFPSRPRSYLEAQPLPEPLTAREREVLRLLVTGLSIQEIAQKLFITAGTLKTHTKNIYSKLNVHNRVQAVARARELDVL
jgi:LuxR family maltose regulon positive regulatory protein